MNTSPAPGFDPQYKTIHVLGIAPYEGLKTLMQKIALERSDILLDAFVGDLYQGAEIIRQHANKNYDIVISRGGTAELIRHMTSIPVVEIGLSSYDILQTIKLTENYAGKYAIVAFPGITDNAQLLCNLLQFHVDIFTVHNQEEVVPTLSSLKQEGYQMVLCDTIGYSCARKLGLNAVLVTSGAESISSAFDQAVRICRDRHELQMETQFLRELLCSGNDHTLVLGEDGSVFFSSFDGTAFPGLPELLIPEIPAVLTKKVQKFFKNIDEVQYSFTAKSLSFETRRYAAFYFTQNSVPFATSKYGIQYSNLPADEDSFFDSFYSITNIDTALRTAIESINQTHLPVMLSGEPGSGKEQVAKILYSQSALRANPLITVNCALLTDRSWNFLTNHYNSPFNDNNNTIYLKDITTLSGSSCR